MQVRVTIVPTQGKPVEQTIDVAASGASVEEICKAGGIDPTNKDLTINGQPAQLNSHVGQNDVLHAKERGKATVAVSERPRGS